jgi:Ca-activated chloride channel homolog
MMHRNVNKTVAALAVFGVLAAACGGDDESAERGDAESSLFADETAADETAGPGGDAELDMIDGTEAPLTPSPAVDAEAATDLESAPATVAASEESAEATTEAAATADTVASADSTGGLFGDDVEAPATTAVDDSSRLEGNVFQNYGYRDFVAAGTDPLSTFALDVDTGSYTLLRRWLDEGTLPPIDAVRPEEFVNAFDYDYRAPRRGLDVSIDGGPSPFNRDTYLVRVGVQGEIVDDGDRLPVALTFVVDTSGSMDRDDRLGLVKRSLELLVDELDAGDTVAIVTYDDSAGVVLMPTPVSERDVILDAIDDLQPGGSTNLESGLRQGYALASEAFRRDGINRVVLASDGVANVGVTDPTALAQQIGNDADRGIDLVTVGFGMGNYNDVTMEQLADQGNGFYAYVDTDDEAERLFSDELTSTLVTIARDAKIQVEFDADVVDEYRLIGFENRGVRDDQFRDDAVDAGELGAGHQVTAIYEIELARGVTVDDRDEIGTVFLRWQEPDGADVIEIDDEIRLRDIEPDWTETPADFQLATVVAAFAEVMRDNPYADRVEIDDLADEADRLADEFDTRDVDDLADMIARAAELR